MRHAPIETEPLDKPKSERSVVVLTKLRIPVADFDMDLVIVSYDVKRDRRTAVNDGIRDKFAHNDSGVGVRIHSPQRAPSVLGSSPVKR